ncbi:hypothetical protein P0L94_09745 [Microbacter sp. GSS18]|nr:hypothetical protein P0L94_09745 [Microbacter sp. GSS18]
MYTVYTAQKLDAHRAAELARENEMILAHYERGAAKKRPTGFAVVTDWFTGLVRPRTRLVAAHTG